MVKTKPKMQVSEGGREEREGLIEIRTKSKVGERGQEGEMNINRLVESCAKSKLCEMRREVV